VTPNITLLSEFTHALSDGILKRWYPLVVDKECGGYFTNVTYDWKLAPEQEKMIVSQARHVWTTAKVAGIFEGAGMYREIARHGYTFLRDVMWDKEYGGYFQIRNREGGASDVRGWRDEKRTYGNAFAVYALAALYDLSRDPKVLESARRSFSWIEDHAYDPRNKGYFQFLTREGKPFDRPSEYKTIASDGNELGFKDQNSSIHLLEAYTELYKVWHDPKLRAQLASILALIRDVMVSDKGYLQLFFHDDWTPVSFRDASAEERQENYGLDHVSFGHDYETAFLMLEASHALGTKNDTTTLAVARKMLDHALANGWDTSVGGFYDGGYYFKGEKGCTVIKDTKNWWAQAEGLNALLIFSRIFPEAGYDPYFLKQWEYVKRYILDPDQGDWFEGGLDKEPHFKTGPKSQMWKCTYHTGRTLMNCIALLAEKPPAGMSDGFVKKQEEMAGFVEHWRETARHAGSGLR
jgi:mannobiose 2-epimerase